MTLLGKADEGYTVWGMRFFWTGAGHVVCSRTRNKMRWIQTNTTDGSERTLTRDEARVELQRAGILDDSGRAT